MQINFDHLDYFVTFENLIKLLCQTEEFVGIKFNPNDERVFIDGSRAVVV